MLPDVMSPMFAGLPGVFANVTLCAGVVPCHAQLTAVPLAIVTVFGLNALAGPTFTVVTVVAVVVNVSAGAPVKRAAVADAVWSPVPLPRLRWALALPFVPVTF